MITYNPHRNSVTSHLETISKTLGKLGTNYNKMILLSDCNAETRMVEFLSIYSLRNFV